MSEKDIVIQYRFDNVNRKRGLYKEMSKEERAKRLDNIICPRCKYQNHKIFIQKYGKCNLCGTTLDSNYFRKIMLKKLKES